MLTKISEIKINNRFRKDYGDLESLARSIEEIGLLHPVVINSEHELVCGGRRIEAMRLLGRDEIAARIIDIESVILGEYAENEVRKDFTDSERVAIARAVEESLAGRVGRPSKEEISQNFGELKGKRSDEIAAQKAGFNNKETYRQAKNVVDNGVTELVKKMDDGEVSIFAASNIAALPKKEQSEVIARGEKEIIAEARRIERQRRSEREKAKIEAREAAIAATIQSDIEAELILADIRQGLPSIPDASVDIIVTDPPYPYEFIDTFSALSLVASRVLKPGGIAIVMSGQIHLPEVFLRLTEHLTYHWTAAYLTPGGQAVQIFPRKVNTFWKPLIILSNGEANLSNWFGDVTKSAVNDNDKKHHHWGQSISGLKDILSRFSNPGQTILDPFVGGGSTAVASYLAHCKFIGVDIDQSALDITRARLGEINGAA